MDTFEAFIALAQRAEALEREVQSLRQGLDCEVRSLRQILDRVMAHRTLKITDVLDLPVAEEVLALICIGRKIEAVQTVYEATGLRIKTTKVLVEQWEYMYCEE